MRTALVGSALLALLVLAAVGSADERWGGGVEERGVPNGLINYSFTILVLLIVALVVVIVDALRDRKSLARLPDRGGVHPLVSLVLVLAALAAYGALTDRQLGGESEDGATFGRRDADRTSRGAGGEEQGIEFQWWLAITVGVLLAGYLLYRRKQRRRTRPSAAEELEAVLTETLDELELDPDPRRAVIQAYARMESVLAAHGHGRLPHEAPLEYLARVLRDLDVRAEAAHALTELFERARFSTHQIDLAMRAEAVASLEAVRDDLRDAA
jgi:hypothetical protein